MKTNDTIKVHLYDLHNKEIQTRNYGKVFRVYEKAGKSMVSPQLSGYTTVTIPLLNSLSLANHDMRKTWYCV